jgi:hypothetical protein
MRHIALLASLALLPGVADAATGGPRLKVGMPYPQVRRDLIQQGYLPVRILGREDANPTCDRDPALCRTYPEVANCTGAGASFCAWLYRRRSDARYWMVVTKGDHGTPRDMGRVRYDNDGPADRADLAGLVVETVKGGRERFTYPSQPDPLCSASGGQTPRWITPPPGYKPPK